MRRVVTAAVILSIALNGLSTMPAWAEKKFVYDDQGRPDPFIPWVTPDGRLQILVSQEKSTAEDLKIEGIIYDKRGLSYAVVDGDVVKVGDLIQGYQVLKIEENKVILIKEGQPKEVVLEEEGL